MDWKYKHFNQEAVFKAPRQDVLAAARLSAAESLELVTDTTDGFIARGYKAWHAVIATFILPSTGNVGLLGELMPTGPEWPRQLSFLPMSTSSPASAVPSLPSR